MRGTGWGGSGPVGGTFRGMGEAGECDGRGGSGLGLLVMAGLLAWRGRRGAWELVVGRGLRLRHAATGVG